MKVLNLNDTVYDIVTAHPELADIIASMGFPQIRSKFMLATLGKRYTLKDAVAFAKLELDAVKKILEENGFTLRN